MSRSERVRSLEHYRNQIAALAEAGAGSVSLGFAEELYQAAVAELEQAHGEFTIAQAVEKSGRSRSWFERRLAGWAEEGLARKPGTEWLLKAATIPPRLSADPHGFDPGLSDDAILARLAEDDKAA